MAITTLDGALFAQPPRHFHKYNVNAKTASSWHSFWGWPGNPGAGAFDATLNGANLSAPVNGQLPFTNPGSGNSYLMRWTCNIFTVGPVWLADRLWQNQISATSTSAQNITQPTLPARDINGATSGDGVFIGLEVSADMGAANPSTTTISYTNSANTSGRTGSLFNVAGMSGAKAGWFCAFTLQAGDTGVRSVQSITLNTSWLSGTVGLTAFRILANSVNLGNGSPIAEVDLISGGMPRLYNDTVPFLLSYDSSASAGAFALGDFVVTQG